MNKVLSIRGVSEELMRRLKVRAAEEGRTVREVVIRILEEGVVVLAAKTEARP